MSEEQDIFELIEQYLRGELEREELDRFRNRMRNEPDFAREVELHRAVVESINEARKKELKDYLKENAKVEYIGNIWGKTWLYASAAIVVVMVGLFFYSRTLENGGQIAQNESEDEEVVTKDKKKSYTWDFGDSTGDTTGRDTSIMLAQAEDENRFESDKDVLLDANEAPEAMKPARMSNLAEEEAQLEAEGIEDSLVRKDKMIASSMYNVQVIKMITPAAAYFKNADEVTISSSETTEVTEKKKGIFGRKKEEEAPAGETYENRDDQEKEERTLSSRQMEVEFWSSPVNYKGYMYNGSTLMLYGVGPTESIELKQLNNQLYLKRNGQYYTILVTKTYKNFSKLTDKKVIEELNR